MQQTTKQTKTSIVVTIRRTAGDCLADLYIPVMVNTMVATLVRLAVGTIYALVLATTALAIEAGMTAAARAKFSSNLHVVSVARKTRKVYALRRSNG